MIVHRESPEERCVSQTFLRAAAMFTKVPLAANPKRATLITIKERWFHWLIEKTLVRTTSKERAETDNKKTAKSVMAHGSYGAVSDLARILSSERKEPR